MRSLLLFAFSFAFVCVASLRAGDEDYVHDRDVQKLLNTAHFGFGPIGTTPDITEGEGALKRIMKKKDAIKFLFPVFDKGTGEGRCYALVGFWLLSPEYFESSCKRIAQWNDSKISTVEGGIVVEYTLAEVIQAIRQGRYDDAALGKKKG